MAPSPRMQHLVPRGYLARFADAEGRIDVVSRDDPTQQRRMRVTEVATQRDYYTLSDREGDERFALENALGKVETAGLAAIREVCEEGLALTAVRRKAMCRLIAYQHTRGQRSRRTGEAIAATIESLMPSAWTEPSGELSHGMTRNAAGEVEPHPLDHLRLMLKVARQAETILGTRHAFVHEFPEPMLLTSDEPVHCSAYPWRNPLEGVGPATADEIWFPLDPRRFLLLSPHVMAGWWLGASTSEDAAIVINRAIATRAYSEMYVSPGTDPLAAFTLEPTLPLMRVSQPHKIDVDGVNAPPVRKRPRRR